MHYEYIPHGVCASKIEFELKDGLLSKCRFSGGCNGNLKGISQLVEGMQAGRVKDLLLGTCCGYKNTSCPDQLARAIAKALEDKE